MTGLRRRYYRVRLKVEFSVALAIAAYIYIYMCVYRADVDRWADKVGALSCRDGRRQDGAVILFHAAVVVASHLSTETQRGKVLTSIVSSIQLQ